MKIDEPGNPIKIWIDESASIPSELWDRLRADMILEFIENSPDSEKTVATTPIRATFECTIEEPFPTFERITPSTQQQPYGKRYRRQLRAGGLWK